jgi:radical SAM protein with 4Fe4S-binding SPASM domain
LKERSYAAWSAGLHREVSRRRIPLSGTLELTHRCPLACAHCYNNLPPGDKDARARELSTAEYCRIIDEIAAEGCLFLLLSGGEILARHDFLDIYRHARGCGLLITLFTNAIMVTPALVAALVEQPPFSIEVTLYGHTREVYEELTRLPGSFARARRGVQLMLDAGLPLKLKTMATSINRHEVLAMQEYSQTDLGTAFKFDAQIHPRIDNDQGPVDVRLLPIEAVAFDLADRRRVDEWIEFARTFHVAPIQPEKLYSCGGGIGSFAVDPYGLLSLCVISKRDQFDLRKGSFHEGWQSFLSQVRHRPATRTTKCTRCHLRAMCGMCPANGELANGDPEEPVDFLCETAHLRAHVVGLSIPEHGDCEYCAGGKHHEALLANVAHLVAGGYQMMISAPPGEKERPTGQRRLPTLPLALTDAGGCGTCR